LHHRTEAVGPKDLLNADNHFAFGENWARYADLIGDAQLTEAIAGLHRLLGDMSLQGCRFLDIGSGSGLHSLAALRLGAAEVVAVDIDAHSVATTQAVLTRFASGSRYRVERRSVFDLDPTAFGQFDVVYSWGVLHHTGNMVAALRQATRLVANGGVFAFALYRRTWLCRLWTWEKRWYTQASAGKQKMARSLYSIWFRLIMRLVAIRRWLLNLAGGAKNSENSSQSNFSEYVANYPIFRGMDFYHDMHDWLGGFPYESTLPDDVDALMSGCGLRHKTSHLYTGGRGRTHGLLGSSCDEYVYVKEQK
jgi:SAM-dependent methyltransferase